ncbi:MAG: prepilin peptidase [Labilithrix sp.]|nr:prepilin peptidase [Labilithrix sp.]
MSFVLTLAVATTAAAAYTDIRKGEIPNWLTFGAFGAGLVASAATAAHAFGPDPRAIGLAVLGALGGGLACAILPFFLWRSGVMGGGDVKLFIALGALCHAGAGLDIELTSFIAGSLVAPVQLAFRGKLLETIKRIGMLLANLALPETKRFAIPRSEMTWFRFGPAILLATIWVCMVGPRW